MYPSVLTDSSPKTGEHLRSNPGAAGGGGIDSGALAELSACDEVAKVLFCGEKCKLDAILVPILMQMKFFLKKYSKKLA